MSVHSLITITVFFTLTAISETKIGTTLFSQKNVDSICWSPEDVAKLRVRSLFENLAPRKVDPDEVDSKYVKNAIKYLETALKLTDSDTNLKSKAIFEKVLADTFGAHLKCEILPSVRIAYYAGYVNYEDARQLHDYLDKIKKMLNTQGIGWGEPKEPDWTNLTVAKISISSQTFFDPCAELITFKDHNSCIRLPPPKIDDEDQPSAVALPFKSGGLVSLTSSNSESIIVKFYKSAASCILSNSPVNCRDTDLANFHKEMWYWMKRNVAPHLNEDKLYVAYGGVLKVAATVQSSGLSGLMKENIFRKPIEKIKSTWKFIQEKNSNWIIYTAIIVIAFIAFCLLQFCYNYMFGDANACECLKKKKSDQSVGYTNVRTVFPHIKRSTSSKKTKYTYVPSRCKNLSLAAIPTQKVYDMNANAEKMMAILMSDQNDTSEDESDEISEVDSPNQILEPSPPKIDTHTSQIRTPYSGKSKSLFSTSSFSRSEINYRQREENSIYSESGRSEISVASDSVNNRDLGSVPRISQQCGLRKSFSTEIDVNSYLTPLSRKNLN